MRNIPFIEVATNGTSIRLKNKRITIKESPIKGVSVIEFLRFTGKKSKGKTCFNVYKRGIEATYLNLSDDGVLELFELLHHEIKRIAKK